MTWTVIGMMTSKVLGVIVAVDGDIAQVGMYDLSNASNFLWEGNILSGPKVGALLTITQNEVKIIVKVSKEMVIDQQNTVKSVQFDNRYKKNSVNRIVTVKTQGVIIQHIFRVTREYVPMIGNEVTVTGKEDLNSIFGISDSSEAISIGKSILEKQKIDIPINRFFASHIGIFGNTGSGKSNTLHKLYLELFRWAEKNGLYRNLCAKSKFFVIDFNGEYIGEKIFEMDEKDKCIFKINTRHPEESEKIPVKKAYLFDADILSILFDAKPGTQIPFLRTAMNIFNTKLMKSDKGSMGKIFSGLECGLLVSLFKNCKNIEEIMIQRWIEIAENLGIPKDALEKISVAYRICFGNAILKQTNDGNTTIFENGQLTSAGSEAIDKLKEILAQKYQECTPIKQLKVFFEFQEIYATAWGKMKYDYIHPLIKRMETAFASLENTIELTKNIRDEYKCMNIFCLVHANQEMKRLIPMLVSKMLYDEQKENVSGNDRVNQTRHLIIDEAHNILNDKYRNNGDSWQDYRLSIFEEIIKEGRKFGFYLTLASQRPADISPTIMSQVHNYFIHRLVNENDLYMLANTMPTLDKYSYNAIPSLGQGEAIITGTAMPLSVMVKIDKELKIRPKSDDIKLTELWENEI